MTLKDARQFRDYIIAKSGVNCSVPLGYGPDGYFPVSVLRTGQHRWTSRQEFRDWFAKRLRERRRTHREYIASLHRARRPRSPIEMLVDRACGLS